MDDLIRIVAELGFRGGLDWLLPHLHEACYLAGAVLVGLGWFEHRRLSRSAPGAAAVTAGLSRFVRHPQYVGLLLIAVGVLIQWTTLSLLVASPLLVLLYYWVTRRREAVLEREYGDLVRTDRDRTGRTLPRFRSRFR